MPRQKAKLKRDNRNLKTGSPRKSISSLSRFKTSCAQWSRIKFYGKRLATTDPRIKAFEKLRGRKSMEYFHRKEKRLFLVEYFMLEPQDSISGFHLLNETSNKSSVIKMIMKRSFIGRELSKRGKWGHYGDEMERFLLKARGPIYIPFTCDFRVCL